MDTGDADYGQESMDDILVYDVEGESYNEDLDPFEPSMISSRNRAKPADDEDGEAGRLSPAESEEDEEDEEDDSEDQGDGKPAVGVVPDDPVLVQSGESATVLIVRPEDRVTSNFLQLTELAQVLAIRAEQISKGSQPFVTTDDYDPISIAKKELESARSPLKIRRYVGMSQGGVPTYEEWKVSELSIVPIDDIRDVA